MPEYKFLGEFVADIIDIEFSLLLADFGVESHMQQHVAKLLTYIRIVLPHESITKFVDFLYGVGSQRFIGLLAVPRAFLSEIVEDIEKVSESLQFFFLCVFGHFYLLFYFLFFLSQCTPYLS